MTARLIITTLGLLLTIAVVPPGRAQQTQASLDNEIQTLLPSGMPGGIPAVSLRQVLTDMNAAIFQPPNVSLPATSSASVGTILIGNVAILHAFGDRNVFLGENSGNFTMTGGSSLGMGFDTLVAVTTGMNLVAVGNSSLLSNTTGDYNVAVGSLAMSANTTSSNNVAVGTGALAAFNPGGPFGSNTAVGTDAAFTLTGAGGFGYDNICIGSEACGGITIGTTNTILSTFLAGLPPTLSGSIIIAAGPTVEIDYNYTTAATWTLRGHVMAGVGTTPSLTAGCNGAGSGVGASTDSSGTVTGQTAAATTCTLTFGTAYGAAPNCSVSGLSSPLTGAVTVAAGSIVVNFASTASYKWSYNCLGA